MSNENVSEQQDFELRYFITVDGDKYVNGTFIAFSPEEAEKYSSDDTLFEISKKQYESVGPTTQYTGEKLKEGEAKVLPPTIEDKKIIKESLLSEASSAITVPQTKLLLGRKLTTDEEKSLNVWVDYMDALQNTDISSEGSVEWPEAPPQ